LAEDCEFGATKKERIRDQFVAGIADEKLAEKLEHLYLNNRDRYTLDLVMEYTRSYCDVKGGRRAEKENKPAEYVCAVSGNRKPGIAHQLGSDVRGCPYCGLGHGKGKCAAYGKKCNNCGKFNHFARMCRDTRLSTRSRQEERSRGWKSSGQILEVTNASQACEDGNDYSFFLGECIVKNSEQWLVELNLFCDSSTKVRVKFKIDTGADVSLLAYDDFLQLRPRPVLAAARTRLLTPSGELQILGMCQCYLFHGGENFQESFYVLPRENKTNSILSRTASVALALVK
jgi:hypothetical protein